MANSAEDTVKIYQIDSFRGGVSDYEDKGTPGSFKFGYNLDIRKKVDSLSAGQALTDIGLIKQNPSPSISPSSSLSPSSSISSSISPSTSYSPSSSDSPSASGSASRSPSASLSPSSSYSQSSSLSPSPSPSAGLTTVFSDLIRFFVNCSDGATYGFGNTGKVYKIDRDLNCSQVYNLQMQIKGAVEKPSSNKKTYLEFCEDTKVHRKEIPGLANWNDVDKAGTVQGDTWPKTNLSSQDWHTMVNVGGSIMIADGNRVAMSAYDDSYTNEALDLIPGNTSKTMQERNGRLIVGTHPTGFSTRGTNAAIDSEVPLAQVGTDGQIMYADLVSRMPLKKFPGGGYVNPGGVANETSQMGFFEWIQTALSWTNKQVYGNLPYWGVFGATDGYNGIYTYGRMEKNMPFAMNLEYKMDVDEIGAVTFVNGVMIASYRDGSDFGVKAVDSTTKANAMYSGLDFKAPQKKPMDITKWSIAEIFMKPLPSGCSIQLQYKMDKTGDFVTARTSDNATSYSTTNGKKAVFSIQADGQIFEPRILLTSSGNTTAEIYRLRVYFS